jgi:hypothetical protein
VPAQAVLAGPADVRADLSVRRELDLARHPQAGSGREHLRGVGALRDSLRSELAPDPRNGRCCGVG